MTPTKGMSMHPARKLLVALAGVAALALAAAAPASADPQQPESTYIVFAQESPVTLFGSNNAGDYSLDTKASVRDVHGAEIDGAAATVVEVGTDNPCTRKLVADYEGADANESDGTPAYAEFHAELVVTFTGGTCPESTDEPTATPTVTDEPTATETPTATVTATETETATATATSTPECTCPTPCADEAECHACQVTVNNWVVTGTTTPAEQSSTRTVVKVVGAADFVG